MSGLLPGIRSIVLPAVIGCMTIGCSSPGYRTGYYSAPGTSPSLATVPNYSVTSYPSTTPSTSFPQPASPYPSPYFPENSVKSPGAPVAMNAGLPSIPATPFSSPPGSPYPATASLTPVPIPQQYAPQPSASQSSAAQPHSHPHPHPHAAPPQPQPLVPANPPAASPPPASSSMAPQPLAPTQIAAIGKPIPVANPAGRNVQWTPWPLPARSAMNTTPMPNPSHPMIPTSQSGVRSRLRHLSVATRPGSRAERVAREEASLTSANASAMAEAKSEAAEPAFALPAVDANADPFASPEPKKTETELPPIDALPAVNPVEQETAKILKYRGGKTLPNLGYVNLYIGGEHRWNMTDVENIDRALAAAMTDEQLNNVIRQYFDNQPIGTTVHPSHPLAGEVGEKVSRGDIKLFLEHLHSEGQLESYDLNTTVFNFVCPPGTILTDADEPVTSAGSSVDGAVEVHSLNGLGGYHGSIHIGDQTLYYTASVFSEQRPDGFKNGISAFPEGWKNTVATMYHQLQEARTNPDVEDVIRNPKDPEIVSKLGWTSDDGEEIGDAPLLDTVVISEVIKEVPLSNGDGTVPIQLLYSNAAKGPEGPIPDLHPIPAN